MKENFSYLFFDYWYIAFYILSFMFTIISCFEIKDFKQKRASIKNVIGRCMFCEAEVIRPVLMEFTYSDILKSGTELISGLPITLISSKDNVNTLVRYTVNGKTIETVIKRRSHFRHPKPGDSIKILYDPELPQHALGTDMQNLILRRPLLHCLGYIFISLLFAICGIFWQISPPI